MQRLKPPRAAPPGLQLQQQGSSRNTGPQAQGLRPHQGTTLASAEPRDGDTSVAADTLADADAATHSADTSLSARGLQADAADASRPGTGGGSGGNMQEAAVGARAAAHVARPFSGASLDEVADAARAALPMQQVRRGKLQKFQALGPIRCLPPGLKPLTSRVAWAA